MNDYIQIKSAFGRFQFINGYVHFRRQIVRKFKITALPGPDFPFVVQNKVYNSFFFLCLDFACFSLKLADLVANVILYLHQPIFKGSPQQLFLEVDLADQLGPEIEEPHAFVVKRVMSVIEERP